MAALLEKMGPSILVTHSMGGTIGWRTPFRTDKVKAIIAFEPGGSPFIFPEGEVPEPVPTLYDPVKAQAMGVPLESFLALTKLPMVLFMVTTFRMARLMKLAPISGAANS